MAARHSGMLALSVLALSGGACAATTSARLGRTRVAPRRVLRSAAAAPRMMDAGALSGLLDAFPVDAFAATPWLLADAVAAGADAVEAVAEASDPNLFDQYVNLIRTAIVMLHEQLNNAGVPGAFGFSIFLFTLGVKLLVLPLNWKQMEGTVAMQKLQPRTKQLTKWFGENQQALAIETSNLYKNNNVNPLAGCLPSVAQIPIFIGLYRAIIGLSQDKILDESFFWLPSLEGPVSDYGKGMGWLTENWVDGHPALGWHDTLCYLTLPVILVLSQSFSMKVLAPPPTGDDSAQAAQTQQILKFLPLMIGWFSLSAPAGLGLYWFWNNIITTAQSVAIKTAMGAWPEAVLEKKPAELN